MPRSVLGVRESGVAVEQPSLFGPADAPVAVWRHPKANRECVLGECIVAYHFDRGSRRTIGLLAGPNGLQVRAPRWTTEAEVHAFLLSKRDWLLKQWQFQQSRTDQQWLPGAWADGMSLPFLGETLTVVLRQQPAADVPAVVQQGDRLLVDHLAGSSPAQLKDTLLAWLKQEARQLFVARLDHYARRLGVHWQQLGLSQASTRWGSASAGGRIRLNWRLIHLPLSLIDYVVVHELSHLREMHHGPAFWAVVCGVLPDYAERRQALQRYALPSR